MGKLYFAPIFFLHLNIGTHVTVTLTKTLIPMPVTNVLFDISGGGEEGGMGECINEKKINFWL
jgi:hypothetical protein